MEKKGVFPPVMVSLMMEQNVVLGRLLKQLMFLFYLGGQSRITVFKLQSHAEDTKVLGRDWGGRRKQPGRGCDTWEHLKTGGNTFSN